MELILFLKEEKKRFLPSVRKSWSKGVNPIQEQISLKFIYGPLHQLNCKLNYNIYGLNARLI